jgi:hypothetical protein
MLVEKLDVPTLLKKGIKTFVHSHIAPFRSSFFIKHKILFRKVFTNWNSPELNTHEGFCCEEASHDDSYSFSFLYPVTYCIYLCLQILLK